jgi:hypothetical protein
MRSTRNMTLSISGSGMKALAILVLCAATAACTASKKEPAEAAGVAGTESVELRSNERDLYPRLEDVAVRSVERLTGEVGVGLELVSDMDGFSHFAYSTNGEPFRDLAGGRLILRFEDRHTPDVQVTNTVVRPVDASGRASGDRFINVNYYPRELYAKAGQTAPGYVILRKTDIPLASTRVADWIVDRPTPEDVAFASATWGKALEGAATPLDKARRLARALMDELQAHRGTPSDRMNAPPFEQYRRAMAGEDRVWCSNLADVFVRASNALGVPARVIKMIRWLSKGEAYDLLAAEGHSTTEIFAADLNRWIWIDLTFLMTGMELPGRGPIPMAELVRALNDPDRIGELTAIVYDPATKAETRVSVPDCAARDSLLNFFKRDQTFTYTRRTSR